MLRPSCETFDSASPSKTKALQAQLKPYSSSTAAVREVALLKRPSPELIAKNFKKQVLKEVEEQLVHRLTNTKPSRAFRYGEQAWEQIQELIEHKILEAEEEMPQTISPSQARDIAALLTHRLDVQDENIFNADLFKRDVQDGQIVVKNKNKATASQELQVKKRKKRQN